MCSRKSLGPRIEPWETPALIKCFCEDLPSRATQIGKVSQSLWSTLKSDRWVDRENFFHVRWNRIKNHAQRPRGWSIEEKELRHWVK